MDFGNKIKKEFTTDHRRNYTLYNKSNIFNINTDVDNINKTQEKPIVYILNK
jgi:hypothetical protein